MDSTTGLTRRGKRFRLPEAAPAVPAALAAPARGAPARGAHSRGAHSRGPRSMPLRGASAAAAAPPPPPDTAAPPAVPPPPPPPAEALAVLARHFPPDLRPHLMRVCCAWRAAAGAEVTSAVLNLSRLWGICDLMYLRNGGQVQRAPPTPSFVAAALQAVLAARPNLVELTLVRPCAGGRGRCAYAAAACPYTWVAQPASSTEALHGAPRTQGLPADATVRAIARAGGGTLPPIAGTPQQLALAVAALLRMRFLRRVELVAFPEDAVHAAPLAAL